MAWQHSRAAAEIDPAPDPYWLDVNDCHPNGGNDYCAVHSNCTVPGKWFQLLSEGGVHYGTVVDGIGIENAIKIAFRANVYYWTSYTDFAEAAYATVTAAEDLDQTGVWAAATLQAWNAVGVAMPEPRLEFSYPDGLRNLLRRRKLFLQLDLSLFRPIHSLTKIYQ